MLSFSIADSNLKTCKNHILYVPTIQGNIVWYTLEKHNCLVANKGNNKITELRTILQRESQNS